MVKVRSLTTTFRAKVQHCNHYTTDMLPAINSLHLFIYFSYETQKNGLVLLYDMTGSGYHNFDYNLARKIMGLLKVNKIIY